MDVFKSNSYPGNFINNFLKTFLDNKHRIQEKVITVLKKPLFLALPYTGPLSLQTGTKLRKSLNIDANGCLISKCSEMLYKLTSTCFFITMTLSEAALKKLLKEEIINLAFDYQSKLDSTLTAIRNELSELKKRL